MDDKKQIEEMAKMLSEDCGNCDMCKYCGTGDNKVDCIEYYNANKIYNAGYRNCKDKVVLTREEYEKLKKDNYQQGFLDGNIYETKMDELSLQLAQARNETAREILQELYMYFSSDYLVGLRNEYKDWKFADFIKRFAKQYGVEVEE